MCSQTSSAVLCYIFPWCKYFGSVRIAFSKNAILTSSSLRPTSFFYCCRIQEDISTLLKPVSLVLNWRHEVTVLFPRMDEDLFDRLQSGEKNPIGLVQGLRIVQQMTDALENCWIRGIHHVDLRITNVLVLIIFTSFSPLFEVGFPLAIFLGPLDDFFFLAGLKNIF